MGTTMHEDRYGAVSKSLDVASVAANTSAEQTFTVNGLRVGDMVFVNKPAASAGLGVVGCRVSAVDTLAITFMNATGVAIDPAAETYLIFVFRSELTPPAQFNR
jgi:hypothetical protein